MKDDFIYLDISLDSLTIVQREGKTRKKACKLFRFSLCCQDLLSSFTKFQPALSFNPLSNSVYGASWYHASVS